MSFHPQMPYGTPQWHKSERKLADEGAAFEFTPEARAKLDRILQRYPAERRKSALLPALYLVQEQQGYVSGSAMTHVASIIGCTRAEVEDVVSYYVMFFTQPVGKYVLQVCRTLACGLNGAGRVTEELVQAVGHRAQRDHARRHVHVDGDGVPGRVRSGARDHGQQRALARVREARGRRRA